MKNSLKNAIQKSPHTRNAKDIIANLEKIQTILDLSDEGLQDLYDSEIIKIDANKASLQTKGPSAVYTNSWHDLIKELQPLFPSIKIPNNEEKGLPFLTKAMPQFVKTVRGFYWASWKPDSENQHVLVSQKEQYQDPLFPGIVLEQTFTDKDGNTSKKQFISQAPSYHLFFKHEDTFLAEKKQSIVDIYDERLALPEIVLSSTMPIHSGKDIEPVLLQEIKNQYKVSLSSDQITVRFNLDANANLTNQLISLLEINLTEEQFKTLLGQSNLIPMSVHKKAQRASLFPAADAFFLLAVQSQNQ